MASSHRDAWVRERGGSVLLRRGSRDRVARHPYPVRHVGHAVLTSSRAEDTSVLRQEGGENRPVTCRSHFSLMHIFSADGACNRRSRSNAFSMTITWLGPVGGISTLPEHREIPSVGPRQAHGVGEAHLRALTATAHLRLECCSALSYLIMVCIDNYFEYAIDMAFRSM